MRAKNSYNSYYNRISIWMQCKKKVGFFLPRLSLNILRRSRLHVIVHFLQEICRTAENRADRELLELLLLLQQCMKEAEVVAQLEAALHSTSFSGVLSHLWHIFLKWPKCAVYLLSFLISDPWNIMKPDSFCLFRFCIASLHGDCTALFVKTFWGPLKPSFHSKEASVSEFLVERYGLRSFAPWQKTDKQKSRNRWRLRLWTSLLSPFQVEMLRRQPELLDDWCDLNVVHFWTRFKCQRRKKSWEFAGLQFILVLIFDWHSGELPMCTMCHANVMQHFPNLVASFAQKGPLQWFVQRFIFWRILARSATMAGHVMGDVSLVVAEAVWPISINPKAWFSWSRFESESISV